jgi:hypothetical protein
MTSDEQLRILAIIGSAHLIAAQLERGEAVEAQMTLFDLQEQATSLDRLIEKRITPEIGDKPQMELFTL